MPSTAIREELIKDFTDTTAAAVVATYPNAYASTSEVPIYAYTSLKTLLGLTSSAELALAVVANLGEGKIPANACIVINTIRTFDNVEYSLGSINSNEIGAEFSDVRIHIRNVRYTNDVSLVKNVGQRIRYLIDHPIRQARFNTAGSLEVINDNSIRDYYLECFRTECGLLTASEWVNIYRVEYVRSFPFS